MCGIAGFIDTGLSNENAGRVLDQMQNVLSHRGPDARGRFVESPVYLGHNRLSIIDLSTEANQPMIYNHLVLIFNGEIYNYIELREELQKKGYRFKTKSDSEVILAAYSEWGSSCISRFVGMWAFVIWNTKDKTLFGSRDRFGIKPFYYIHQGTNLYFASEVKALKHSRFFSNELHEEQVFRGLQLGWAVHPEDTYFKQVKSLPPAAAFEFNNGDLTINNYWSLPEAGEQGISTPEKQAQFKALFTQSISQHMRSDVEVGACLSGGLDSSSIVSAVASQFPENKIKTFTIYYEGSDAVDERPWAVHVLKAYPNIQSFTFSPSPDELVDDFENFVSHQDFPVAGSSPFSQYFLMKLAAREGVKVIIDGQGADEYLGGYKHAVYRQFASYIHAMKLCKAHRQFSRFGHQHQLSSKEKVAYYLKSWISVFQNESQLFKKEYLYHHPFLARQNRSTDHLSYPIPAHRPDRFHHYLAHMTFLSSLPTLLYYEDRNSMAFSLESRVPFLDHRLVEFAFKTGMADKINDGRGKLILRGSLRGITPDAILDRRDKKGFVTPGEVKWLRGPLSWLVDEKMTVPDFLDPQKIDRLMKAYKAGDNSNAKLIWRIALLNHWVKRHS